MALSQPGRLPKIVKSRSRQTPLTIFRRDLFHFSTRLAKPLPAAGGKSLRADRSLLWDIRPANAWRHICDSVGLKLGRLCAIPQDEPRIGSKAGGYLARHGAATGVRTAALSIRAANIAKPRSAAVWANVAAREI
jgi:hypothetical protein